MGKTESIWERRRALPGGQKLPRGGSAGTQIRSQRGSRQHGQSGEKRALGGKMSPSLAAGFKFIEAAECLMQGHLQQRGSGPWRCHLGGGTGVSFPVGTH